MVLDGVVERVGEKLVGAALLAQHFVVHLSVAFECGLETRCPVVFVVKILDWIGSDGGLAIAYGLVAQPKVLKVFVKAFQLVGCLDARHVDEHFLETLIVAERQHGHLAQGDGLGTQPDDERVAGGNRRVDGDKPTGIADAAHPQRVGGVGQDVEPALQVGDGAMTWVLRMG